MASTQKHKIKRPNTVKKHTNHPIRLFPGFSLESADDSLLQGWLETNKQSNTPSHKRKR